MLMQKARIKNATVVRINPYALVNTITSLSIILFFLVEIIDLATLLSRQVIETKVVIDFPLHLFFIFVLFNHDGLRDVLICMLQEITRFLLFSLSSIFDQVFKVLTFGSEDYWYILEIWFLLLFVI